MKRHTVTFVEPAVGHVETRFSDTAKRRSGFGLRYLRCAEKHLSAMNTDISVTFCVVCNRLLF